MPKNKAIFEAFQKDGLTNIYIPIRNEDTHEEIYLGAWHLIPTKLINKTDQHFDYMQSLTNKNCNILLYFHGSGETRIDSRKKFEVLRLHFHIIAVDYRG